ncbi:MAG: sensor histidine kinase [Candidatus Dojkabacteria bacterium]
MNGINLNLLTLSEVVLVCITAGIGIRVFFNKAVTYQAKATFLLTILLTTVWMTAIAIPNFLHLRTSEEVLPFVRLSWGMPILIIGSLAYFFCTKFSIPWRLRIPVFIFIGIGLAFTGLNLVTEAVISGFIEEEHKVVFSSLYPVNIGLLVFEAVYLGFLVKKIYTSLNPQDKLRIKYLSFGFQASIVIGLFTNVFVPLVLATSKYSHIGGVALLPTIIVTYYVLIHDRFHDLRTVKRKLHNFLLFNIIVSSSFYLLFILAYIGNNDLLGFDVFLYGQIIIFTLFLLFDRYVFHDKTGYLQEGFYRYSLIHSENGESLDISKLLKVFASYVEKRYEITSKYIDVVLKEQKRHFVIGKEQSEEAYILFSHRSTIQSNKQHTLHIKIYEKVDGLDLSLQSVKNLTIDIKELIFLVYQSILHEEQKQFSEKLQVKVQEATAELREKYQQEKDMIGIMGHELRTPMTIAKGMQERIIQKIKENKYEPEYFLDKSEKVYDSIVRESELIETMLETSHIDNKKFNILLMPTSIESLIEYSKNAYRKEAENKGLKLVVEKDSNIPKVVTDTNKMQQVLNNLVSNAVKYTPGGYVKIVLRKDANAIYIDVKDTGIGIPKKELKNLGKKFYRVNQYLDKHSSVVRAGGTGLGLYVVKGILKALHCELEVKSEEGRGSTFTVVIPIHSHFDKDFQSQMESTMGDDVDMFAKMGLKR